MLNKALERFETPAGQSRLPYHTNVLIENLDKHSLRKWVVQNVDGFKVVLLEDILYLQGKINYTRLYLRQDKKLRPNKTLKEYKAFLTGFGFFRIHQSHLIKLSYVKECTKGDGGVIVMKKVCT